MIVRALTCLALIALGAEASAQVVEVRSGKHDDFTRLSLNLPERIEWRIETEGDVATISFPGTYLTFDTSSVFRRIPRDRLADITGSGQTGILKLELGCACEVTSFWHGKSLLVFDIRERQEVAQEDPPTATPPPAIYRPSRPASETLLGQRPSLAANLAIADIRPVADSPETSEIVAATPDDTPQDSTDAIIEKSREALVKQLGRAATQGLLSPSTHASFDEAAARPEPEKPQAPDAEQPVQGVAAPPADARSHINLQAQSSIDRDIAAMLLGQSNSLEEAECINPALVDVTSWGTDAPFYQQVGALRVSLMGEFDKVNEEAAISLTKLYIYFGFGDEARLVLNMIDKQTKEMSALYALTAIMDAGHAHQGSPLYGQLRCETPAALWSVLSYETLPTDIPVDTGSVLRAFTALPMHLRSYLGPILSRKLLEAGRRETADSVLRILKRNDETVTPDAELVEAEVDIAEGSNGDAEATLESVTESNSEPSAEALIALVEVKLAEGEEISFELAQLAGAYAHENRGEELEHALIRTYTVALAASGAFDQSYEELGRLSKGLVDDERQIITSQMLSQLTRHADDMTFLRYALSGYGIEGAAPDARVANDAARRLIDAGFAPQARSLLATNVAGDAGQDRKLLRARISLAEGRPRHAEVELLHLEGVEADMLRAQARSAVGEHAEASNLYAATNEEALAETEAWLAEDWSRIASSGNMAVAEMASLLLSETETPLPQSAGGVEPVLAQNRDLVEESAKARGVIEALLQTKPMPTAPAPAQAE